MLEVTVPILKSFGQEEERCIKLFSKAEQAEEGEKKKEKKEKRKKMKKKKKKKQSTNEIAKGARHLNTLISRPPAIYDDC